MLFVYNYYDGNTHKSVPEYQRHSVSNRRVFSTLCKAIEKYGHVLNISNERAVHRPTEQLPKHVVVESSRSTNIWRIFAGLDISQTII